MSYYLLLVLGSLATISALYSIRLGKEYERKVRETLSRQRFRFSPPTCLILACKGDEPGLAKNIGAMVQQDYNDYRTIIVTDTEQDPAHKVAESVIARYPNVKANVITSTAHNQASGKVAALLTALEESGGEAEVYAFIDSDALVHPSWLKELVDPLSDPSIGATTGFRWYFPTHNGFWSHVQAAWNASGSSLLFNDKYNFPWGGAMAVRADTLRKIKIEQVWEKAVSDDLSLNSALRNFGYRISFIPQCTVATFSNITFTSFMRWTTNQITLVRAYHRPLWNYALVAYGFFNTSFVLGFISLIIALWFGPFWLIPASLLLLPTPLGIFGSKIRLGAFKQAIPDLKSEFERTSRGDYIASLIVPWVMTYSIFKSTFTNEIEWRGRRYRLIGANESATSRSIP